MRSAENIKKRIKNTTIKTNPQVNKAVLNDLLDRMDRAERVSINARQPNIWRMVAKSRIGQIAAMIIVVSTICLVILSDKDELERYEAAGPGVAAKTEMPAKPLILISLNIAYRKGGMEAVEKQYEKAFNRTGPRPVKLTVEDLFMELNGG
jgi:hypothetical protein